MEMIPVSVQDLTVRQYFLYQEAVYLISKNQDIGDVVDSLHQMFGVDLSETPIVIKDREKDALNILKAVQANKKPKLSILGLFYYIDMLIRDYSPGEITNPVFDDGSGIEYALHGKVIDLATNTVAPINAGEVIIYKELQRALSSVSDTITDVDYDFTLTTKTLALLFTKTSKEVPLSVAERELWLEKRAKEFEKAPATLALWLRFFFTQHLVRLYLTGVMRPYLKDLKQNHQ